MRLSCQRKSICFGASSRSGFTLIEILISSALLLLLLSATASVFAQTLAYQKRVEAQLDLERSMLSVFKRITREFSESSWVSVHQESGGVIFASPRDANGQFTFRPDESPAWSSFVCYNVEDLEGVPTLVRRQESFLSPLDSAPEPKTFTPVRNVGWFTSSGLPKRIVLRRTETFLTSLELTDSGKNVLKLTLGAGSPLLQNNLDFSLELSTRILPRN